ncbi:unnamed protein product, partial [Staurois parvus]
MGPSTAVLLPAALHRHTLTHVPLSGLLTLLVVSIFGSLGCCYGLPLLLPPPPHCGSTLWFWPQPWTAQMSEVCGDSKIDGNHLHVILDCQYFISLPQQTPMAFKIKGTVFCTNI